MIIYNVTVKIDLDVHEEWLAWMSEVHIPEVMQTGVFLENTISRILLQDETDGISYAFRYKCASMADLQKYFSVYAPHLQKSHGDRYAGKFVAIRTVMEEIQNENSPG